MEETEERESVVYRLELSERDEDDLLTALRWYVSDLEDGGDALRSRVERVENLRNRILHRL